MNRDRAKELLPVIQAFAEGKEVRVRAYGDEAWLITLSPKWKDFLEYEIKPEPREVWIHHSNYASNGTGNYYEESPNIGDGNYVKYREVLDD